MKRILIVLVALLLLLVAGVVVLPYFFKDDIVNYLKNESINGTIEFDEDISIGLISSFPDLNIGIRDLKIINKAPFEGDTLVSLKEIKATVNLMRIIQGHIEVESVDLISPRINVLVMEDETANYDIMLESEEPAAEVGEEGDDAYSFKISSFTITDGFIAYHDTSLATYLTMRGFDFNMSGDFNEERMDISTMSSVKSMTVDFEDVKYLKQTNMTYDADMALYINEEKYEFLENELSLNELGLSLDGVFQFVKEDMFFDLSFGLTKTEFQNLLSMVPAIYTEDFSGLESSGKIGFDGYLKGLMTETEYPEFAFNLLVENGAFKYPDLPSALNNTQVKMAVTNPGGSFDNTVVDISKFHIEVDKEPFDFNILLKTPDSDPYVATKMMGKIQLERIANLVPIEGVSLLKGLIDLNLEAKGNMSAIENEQYEKFYAAGNMKISDFAYQDGDLPAAVGIPNASFTFDPHYASVDVLEMILGESDLKINGKVENYMPYVFHNETIKGELSMLGNNLDLNPWLAETDEESAEEVAEADDYELEVVEVPANINFVFNSNLGNVKYDTYEFQDFKGQVVIKDQILSLNEVGLIMLGGGIVLNGFYNTQNINKPVSDFSFELNDVSIPGLYRTFQSIQMLMPIAEQMNGNVSGNFSIRSILGKDLMPDLESVNGKAKLSIDRVELKGNDLWNKAVDYLGWEESMKKLIITKIKPNFKIINGDVFLDTFDFNLKQQAFKFGGKSSLNQTVDFGLDTEVPTSKISNSAEALIGQLSKNKINVDLADKVDVRFMITGNMMSPDFKPVVLGADGNTLNLKDQAKEAAKELVEKGKQEAIGKTKEELRKQAAKYKNEAEMLKKQAANLKAKAAELSKKGELAKAESLKLRKEADVQKDKIEKEMANLPKLVREKAMEKVDVLFDKANDKADEANKFFDLAKKPEKEADKLLKRAEELEKQADDLLKED